MPSRISDSDLRSIVRTHHNQADHACCGKNQTHDASEAFVMLCFHLITPWS